MPLSEILIKNCLIHIGPEDSISVGTVQSIWKAVLLRKPEGDHLRLRNVKDQLDELCGASTTDYPEFSQDIDWGC